MSKMTAGDVLVDRLIEWGVDTIFGMPGDGINGVMEALRKRKDEIRFIQVRHEEAAAFAACGYAKWTGRLGVCLATSGPGGIHLLNGLYDAKLDGQPVLAITGLQFHDLLHTHTQQDVELDKLFMDVSVYNTRIMGAAHMANAVDLACRAAVSRRGVSHVTIPVDIQSELIATEERSARNVPGHAEGQPGPTMPVPAAEELQAAASILNNGRKTVILAGQGAIGAGDLLEQVAEKLGAPIVKALLGKGAVADDSPYTTGGIGMLGTLPSQEAMENCDTLLIVGSAFPYIEYYPEPGRANVVQIDLDATRIGLRHPVDCGLAGDARAVLRHLEPLLQVREDRSFLEQAQKNMAEWRDLLEERGTRKDMPMKPQVVAHELDRLLAPDAIIATDSGTVTTWAARHLTLKPDMMFSCSGTLASMACGLPYAIAAAIAFPERQVVAFVGDGALTMLIGELATCARYRLDNLKVVVIKNNSLGQIKWEQMVFLGNPEYECELQPIDFEMVARGFGVDGFRIEEPGACAATLATALSSPRTAVIEAIVDPHEPPQPPKVTAKQAAHFARSLARGTPERGKIALTIGSDTVREVL
ncbi:thiamine pyrophosphate-dependent enzyme [Martelella sp. AMO21009]